MTVSQILVLRFVFQVPSRLWRIETSAYPDEATIADYLFVGKFLLCPLDGMQSRFRHS